MKIQSLSVVVPTRGCVNNCAFCVSRMRAEEYKNQMDDNKPFYDIYLRDYIKRLEFARDNGINTVMLTGNGEPQQNRNFLTYFGLFMMLLDRPFRKIELQTTGVLIDEPYLRFLRNHVGVNTISLSVSALDNDINRHYNGTKADIAVDIQQMCQNIKKYDFSLRLSLNMTNWFDEIKAKDILKMCKELGADQVTFRKLYGDETKSNRQSKWVKEYGADPLKLAEIDKFVKEKGRALEKLEFGRTKYSCNGLSIVIDDDCMNMDAKEDLKYLILRPDCKLYSKWDDRASLIF